MPSKVWNPNHTNKVRIISGIDGTWILFQKKEFLSDFPPKIMQIWPKSKVEFWPKVKNQVSTYMWVPSFLALLTISSSYVCLYSSDCVTTILFLTIKDDLFVKRSWQMLDKSFIVNQRDVTV